MELPHHRKKIRLVRRRTRRAENQQGATPAFSLTGTPPLNEMACINQGDGARSPFDRNGYNVQVYGNEGNEEPHFHVAGRQHGWEIKLKISDGSLLQVKRPGNRRRNDAFADIVRLAKEWFPLQSTVDELRNNLQTARHQFFVLNPESPFKDK